ncbi:hypothetical protein ACUTAF_01885 [Pseudomonas sp. SP16.1]|uniref:hypothetical protein n=1 Tax=Pseudomonas sp. SP16.1 TaxID=3458854 RepID=UPI0040457D7C
MTPTPHFTSHAEQVKALGCAAKLDPKKHPRRAAQLKARAKFEKAQKSPINESKKSIHNAAKEERRELAEQARALSHLTMSEAALGLDIPYWCLQKLKYEFGLSFADSLPQNREQEICEAATKCSNYQEVAELTGLTYVYCIRVLHKNGIYLRAGEEEPEALVERARAMAGIGLSKHAAAKSLEIGTARLERLAAKHGIPQYTKSPKVA